MKRVLLTGAGGFVGRHCIPALVTAGYEVHSVSAQPAAQITSTDGTLWHQADLMDSKQVSTLLEQVQPTHLLHSAWYAVPGKYWTASENFRWVEASLQLLQRFAVTGGQRAVGVGSCAEYDWRYGFCSESITPLNPATTYGVCKHALQIMLEALSNQTGLSSAWGRLFFLYGPHEDASRLVASVTRALLQGQPAECSHGRQIRDFLYVRDAADALVALLDNKTVGAVNIASGVPVTLRQVIHGIAERLQRTDLVQLGALPAPDHEPHLLVADVARLRHEVGWAPRFDLATGLDETINWWKLRVPAQ